MELTHLASEDSRYRNVKNILKVNKKKITESCVILNLNKTENRKVCSILQIISNLIVLFHNIFINTQNHLGEK